MNYYQIEFKYLKDKLLNIEEYAKELWEAEKEVRNILKETGVLFKHGYCWPDGSLYLYLKCTTEELENVKSKFLDDSKPTIQEIYLEEPSSNPYKHGCKTLEEYFNK